MGGSYPGDRSERAELRVVVGSDALAHHGARQLRGALEATHGGGLQLVVSDLTGAAEVLLEAVSQEQVDVAVVSADCLGAPLPDGLGLLAVLPRADPRDALVVARKHLEALAQRIAESPETWEPRDLLAALPAEATLCAGSALPLAAALRGRSDLRVFVRPALVQERLSDIEAGELDALIAPAAQLDALELGGHIHRRLDPPWPTVPGQGAVAVVGRINDQAAAVWLQPVEHRPTRLALEAERSLQQALGADPDALVGALAESHGDRVGLQAMVTSRDGTLGAAARRTGEGTRLGVVRLGRQVARELIDRGAAELLAVNAGLRTGGD